MLSHFSCVRLFAALWTVAHQAPLSMRFSRQENWRELPCPPLGDLPDPGIEPTPLRSPALTGRFTTSANFETLAHPGSEAHLHFSFPPQLPGAPFPLLAPEP